MQNLEGQTKSIMVFSEMAYSKLIVPGHLFEGLHIYFLYLAKLRRPGCRDIRVMIPHPLKVKGYAQSITKRGRWKKSPHGEVGRFSRNVFFIQSLFHEA